VRVAKLLFAGIPHPLLACVDPVTLVSLFPPLGNHFRGIPSEPLFFPQERFATPFSAVIWSAASVLERSARRIGLFRVHCSSRGSFYNGQVLPYVARTL